jgi:hypothetical protein
MSRLLSVVLLGAVFVRGPGTLLAKACHPLDIARSHYHCSSANRRPKSSLPGVPVIAEDYLKGLQR